MIRRRSTKRQRQERLYTKLRLQFLLAHPVCQVEGCGCGATEIHHMKGRTGTLLTDVLYFMAVCRPHHVYIETHPAESYEKGYSISRLAK